MTVDWNNYLSEQTKRRAHSVMRMASRSADTISFASGLPNDSCFPLKGLGIKYETPESDFKKTAFGTSDDAKNAAHSEEEVYQACQYFGARGTTYFDKYCRDHVEKYHHPLYPDFGTLIQSGATYSLDALLRLLCDPCEDTVLAEELTYPCFIETCAPMKLPIVSVPMDSDGVIPSELDSILSNWSSNPKTSNLKYPKLFYTMPVGQNPSGITIPNERRQELVDVCKKRNILIIEDDPYFHLQLDKKPGDPEIKSLLQFDTDGRVLRIDSFSKMLMPGMRISIVTANKTFIDKLVMMNSLTIHSAAGPSQLIVYMLMREWGDGGLEKWIAHVQGLYRERRNYMLKAFDDYLPKDLCTWNTPSYGMFIWLALKPEAWPQPREGPDSKLTPTQWALRIEDIVFEQAIKDEIQLNKGHWFMVDQDLPKSGFRATYAFASFEDLVNGTQRLAKALKGAHSATY